MAFINRDDYARTAQVLRCRFADPVAGVYSYSVICVLCGHRVSRGSRYSQGWITLRAHYHRA